MRLCTSVSVHQIYGGLRMPLLPSSVRFSSRLLHLLRLEQSRAHFLCKVQCPVGLIRCLSKLGIHISQLPLTLFPCQQWAHHIVCPEGVAQ